MSAGPQRNREHAGDPWRRTRVGELGEPLLPRWFAIFAVLVIPVGIAVAVFAFLSAGEASVPVAERRPPGTDTLTADVGELLVGTASATAIAAPCPVVEGIRVAGVDLDDPRLRDDIATLTAGLAALCDRALPAQVVEPLRAFGSARGVVRFSVFERTAVDVTSRAGGDASVPVIFVNAKYSRTPAAWLAPLVAYESARLAAADVTAAQGVLAARQAELTVCTTLGLETRTSGCRDAAELLDLSDPLSALRAAGYR